MSEEVERVYFDTSAFNYLRENVRWETFLNTRELQELRSRELLVSPITLWELMLAGATDSTDFLLFCAQRFFSPRLLGTPSELILRYLKHAYPENVVNYDVFTELEIGRTWERMAADDLVTFVYDRDELLRRSSLIRKLSRNLSSVVRYPDYQINDDWLLSIARIVDVYHACLEDDGFPLPSAQTDEARRLLGRIIVLVVVALFILRLDYAPSVIAGFWEKEGFAEGADPQKMLMHFFETYPHILNRGPIIEIAMMAYCQVNRPGRTNRGLLLDSLHTTYTPYVHTLMTADDGFFDLSQESSHFANKFRHIKKLEVSEVPFISKRDIR